MLMALYMIFFVMGYIIHGWLLERRVKEHGFWSLEILRFMVVSNAIFAFIFYLLPYLVRHYVSI